MPRPHLLLSLFALALLAGCSNADGKAALPEKGNADFAVGVRVIQPKDRIDGQLVRLTGRLIPKNEASVNAKASGIISEFLVDVGDRVKKGQPMARLDASNVNISVEQASAAEAVAKAGADNAKLELDRARTLHAAGGVAQAGLDRAEAGSAQAAAGLKQARAARKAAEQARYDHTLRAPFDGVVTERRMNVGEFVSGAAVFSLVDTANLEFVLPVPEAVIGAVQPGATVKGIVSPSGHPFHAKVRVIGEVVNPQGRTVEVRGDLVGERSPAMRPHAIIEVDFSDNEGPDGLFLPRQALRTDGEARYVWVVQDGSLVRRDVQAEVLSPGVVRIISGLGAEENVVSDAGGSFEAGMKVRPLQ